MTIKEIANILNVTEDAIKKHVRVLFPDLMKNGIQTVLNEEQITEIKSRMIPTTAVIAAKTTIERKEIVLEAMRILAEEIDALKKENLEMKPKAEFYDQVTQNESWKSMDEVCKILNLKIGRNKLFEYLRDNNILRYNNHPFQQYVDYGYFRLVESSFVDGNGIIRTNSKPVVSQKGMDFILKLFTRKAING